MNPSDILLEALTSPNPHYIPGHDTARIDAAEALINTEHHDSAVQFLQDVAAGKSLVVGWTLRVRAARILLARGLSL